MTVIHDPIISEQYSGAESAHIDELQSVWRRSLQYALEEELGDRLYELLICIREGMLNALIHGCSGSADKFCHLQITIDRPARKVRVRIDDPGKGHSYDLQRRLATMIPADGQNMGLGIIHHLSDVFVVENKGTSLLFDFSFDVSGRQ